MPISIQQKAELQAQIQGVVSHLQLDENPTRNEKNALDKASSLSDYIDNLPSENPIEP
jgi:hypothetical protein